MILLLYTDIFVSNSEFGTLAVCAVFLQIHFHFTILIHHTSVETDKIIILLHCAVVLFIYGHLCFHPSKYTFFGFCDLLTVIYTVYSIYVVNVLMKMCTGCARVHARVCACVRVHAKPRIPHLFIDKLSTAGSLFLKSSVEGSIIK